MNYIFNYINSSNLADATKYNQAKVLKKFFNFTFNEKITTFSGTQIFPKINCNSKERILSFYTSDEITTLIETIDTNTNLGKRNYAIILLAALLGLRSSDITNLTINDIDWNNKVIKIKQQKSKRLIK